MRGATRSAVIAATVAVVLLTLNAPVGALYTGLLPLNRCITGKFKCVVKKKSCLLNCYAKAATSGAPVDQLCLAKCRDRFDGGADASRGCFARLEAKPGCSTFLDTAALECKTDAFVQDVVEELDPLPLDNASKCRAGKLKCIMKYNKCVLGLFAQATRKGSAIDLTRLPKCTAILSGSGSCFEKFEAKPSCDTFDDQDALAAKDDAYVDDVVCELVQGPKDMNNQRCTDNTAVKCTNAPGGTGGPCTGLGTCEFWYGSPLPVSGGGFPLCETNQWNGPISGTVDLATGESTGTAALIDRVYVGLTIDQPCPTCDGDAWPNDGVSDGTCTGGSRNGLACDGNGISPNPSFGTTSLDCPPVPAALVSSLPIDLSNTNGGSTSITLSAASPSCRMIGHTSLKCPCDVCTLDTTRPCRTDADCTGFGTCGASGAGEPTAPNACLVDGNCDDLGGGEGECGMGPVDQRCAIATQRGCTVPTQATDCPLPDDFCTVAFRSCFPGMNGSIGDSIVANGRHAPQVDHWSRPTFASVSCVPPTASALVNVVEGGLPGPVRFEVSGILTDNGTDSTCPTQLSFTPAARSERDLGWNGIAHDQPFVSGAKVTVAAGCAGTPPGCACLYAGPVPNPNAVP